MIINFKRVALVAAVLVVGLAACGGEPADRGSGQDNERSSRARNDARSSLGSGGAGWPAEPVAHAQPELRAVVTEHDSGRVHVIDIATGKTVETLRVAGQAPVEPAGDDTHVLLPQSAQNATHVIDVGVRWKDHGGHADPAHVAPDVAAKVSTQNPVHVVRYKDHVTVFADDKGAAHVWRQDEDGLDPEPVRTLRTERPHHGFGIALPDGQMLTSLPSKDQRNPLPTGVRLHDKKDRKVRDFTGCPALHGEYGHDGTFVFGCGNGALVLRQRSEGWDAQQLPNPRRNTQQPEDERNDGSGPAKATKGSARLGAFYGGGNEQVVGTYGDHAMAVVDLEKDTIERIDLPHPRADAIWDPYWEQVTLLTSDGKLHALDPETGELKNSTQVMDEFEISSDSTRPQPSISTGENAIYVTDPQQNKLIEVAISSEGFEPRRAKDLDFVPFSIEVLGMAR